MRTGRYIRNRPIIGKILREVMEKYPHVTYKDVAEGKHIIFVYRGENDIYDPKSFKRQAQRMLDDSLGFIDKGRGSEKERT